MNFGQSRIPLTRHIKSDALKLLTWLVCTLVLGAALAPLMFNIGKSVVDFRLLDEEGFLARVLRESEFGRYFNRAMLLAALICLIPLLRSLKMKRSDIGLRKNPSWAPHLFGGFVLAGGLLLLMGHVYIEMGLFGLREGKDWSWSKAGKFLQQGMGASVLEEILFRGLLLAVLLRTTRSFTAALYLTFFFALVHFLKPPESLIINDADVDAGTGFYMVGQIFARFGNPIFIAAEFATYFAVGAVLVWARLRTGSLWLGIGLHGGWVFCLKLYNYHTYVPKAYRPDVVPPYVGADLKIGLIPLTVVCLTGVIAAICLRLVLRKKLGRQKNAAAA